MPKNLEHLECKVQGDILQARANARDEAETMPGHQQGPGEAAGAQGAVKQGKLNGWRSRGRPRTVRSVIVSLSTRFFLLVASQRQAKYEEYS